MRVTSAGLNPDSISAVLNAEFVFTVPPGEPPVLSAGALHVFSLLGSSPTRGNRPLAFHQQKRCF